MDSIVIFKAALNSSVNFIFCLLVVMLFVRIFNIKSPALRFSLFLLPLIKLWFDMGTRFSSGHGFPGPFPLKAGGVFDLCLSAGLGSSGLSLWSLICSCIISQHTYSIGDLILCATGHGLSQTLAALWLSAAALLILYRVLGYLFYTRKLFASAYEDERLKPLADALKRPLYLSPLAKTPMVAGMVNPAILLPVRLPETLEEKELEMVLDHEISHIRRMDNVLNFLLGMTGDIFFFLPPVAFLISKINEEKEKICDLMAAGDHGEKALDLCKTLVKLAASSLREGPSLITHACGFALFPRKAEEGLMGRVTYLLSCKPGKKGIFQQRWAYILVTLALLKLLIGVSFFTSEGAARICTEVAMRIVVSA
ncbi:MAG: M56 family metallopeptidase [Candidatus Eremiobacteraeota bacterium]|nr:M56 family metallopeptidase [Candidatus Eremiobacteraeota bacterium]